MKSKLGLCVTLLGLSTTAFAQDIHFSQIAFSPLTLNPALAGANSSMQGIVNYRSQWKSVASPYKTIAASFDARVNSRRRGKQGHLALGINFFNDQSGDAKIQTTAGALSIAYHIILNKNSTFGGGLNAGFGQRVIDPNAGRWGSQYDGMKYNSNLGSGENFGTPSFTYGDYGAGLVYAYKTEEKYMTGNDHKEFNIGLSGYHLNRPTFSFLGDKNEKLYMRFNFFANAVIGLSNTRWSFMPGVYYQRQKTAQELMVGTYFRYKILEASKITGFNKGAHLALGIFYRAKDAAVAMGMIEWKQYSAGFAYDINVSSLTPVSKAQGGFEVFLRFNIFNDYVWSKSRI